MKKKKDLELYWKCHTANLLKEIVEANPSAWALRMPVVLFRQILVEVAERAIQINDPELNLLMCRLALYEEADPTSKDYNPMIFKKLEKEIKKNRKLKP